MWQPHLFFLGSCMDARWQEVWPRHENKSRERCGSRASSPYLRFFTIETRQWRAFCSVVRQWLQPSRAASCVTQQVSPVNAHMLSLNLSPANLLFQASTIRCGLHGQRPIAP